MRTGTLLQINNTKVRFSFNTNVHFTVPDSLGPDVFVQASVDAHVLGTHLLLGELPDLLDGPRSALLESDFVDTLRHVDGALAGYHLVDRGLVPLLGLRLDHFTQIKSNCGKVNKF